MFKADKFFKAFSLLNVMAKLEFEDLGFSLLEDSLRVRLYKIFFFNIPKSEIEKRIRKFYCRKKFN
jgi:hypothetical protein